MLVEGRAGHRWVRVHWCSELGKLVLSAIVERVRHFTEKEKRARHVGVSSQGVDMVHARGVVHGHVSSTSEWTLIVFIQRVSTTDRCGIDTWNIQTSRFRTLRNVPTGIFTRPKTNRCRRWGRGTSYLKLGIVRSRWRHWLCERLYSTRPQLVGSSCSGWSLCSGIQVFSSILHFRSGFS